MNKEPLHIFFIASWLPSKHDAFVGDFILRHAQSISILNNVSCVYVIESEIAKNENEIVEVETQNNLTIYRIYINEKFAKPWHKNKYYNTVEKYFLLIQQKNKIDIIHANVHWRAGFAAYLLNKKYFLPYVISEHSTYFDSDYYKKNSVANYSFSKKMFSKIALQNANMVLPVSEYLKKWILKFAPKSKTIVVSNVVDSKMFYYTKPNIDLPFVFLHASSASPEKNIDIVLNAALNLSKKNIHFQLKLFTPFNNQIDLFIKKNNLQHIILWHNMIEHLKMPIEMQNSNAFILFSKMETQGCVLIESLCCGRPVITSNLPVFSEMIDEKNGLICINNTVENLEIAMEKIIKNYSDLDTESISINAIKKYSMESIAQQINDVYQICLQKNNS